MIDNKGKGKMVDIVKSQTRINGQTFHQSSPFYCPSLNLVLQHQLPHHAQPQFQFLIRQDPIKGFAAGKDIAARKNARIIPLDPPPVCELIVLPFDEKDEISDVERARYLSTVEVCVHVRLISVDEPHTEIQDQTMDPNGILLVGNVVESPFIAPCTSPFLKDECFFIFSELSVRRSGQYRLRYDLIDRANNHFRTITTVLGDPFTVYSQRKHFGNCLGSTSLIKDIVARGLRLRICKENQKQTVERGEEKKQTKKRRKMSDIDGMLASTQSSLSRPRAISDSVNRLESSNDEHSRGLSFSAYSNEKPSLPPISSSSSSSSRSIYRNDGSSEEFYPTPSGMVSQANGRFDPISNAYLPSHIDNQFYERAEDLRRERYVMDWGKSKDESWQGKSTHSYTPSPYLHDRSAPYNSYHKSVIQDEKRLGKSEYRPSYIGDRYQPTELVRHDHHIRSLSFRSLSHQTSLMRNDLDSIKTERWQEIPVLPPIRRQSDSQSIESELRQMQRSSDFRDDINRYALNVKYDHSKRDNI